MILSGHRAGTGQQGYVDFIKKRLDGAAVLPRPPRAPTPTA